MKDQPCHNARPDGPKSPYARSDSGAPPRLSRRVWHLLREGDVDGRYGGDSLRVLGAVIGEAARVGMDKEAAYALIVQYPGGAFLWDNEMSQRERRRTFDLFFDGSVATYRPSLADASQTRLLLGDMRTAVAAAPWTGPSSTSKVLLAHIHLALLAGRLQHYAGVRRLATEAEVADSTVVSAHKRLTEARLLRLIAPARGTKATEWKLPEDLVDRLKALFPSFLPSVLVHRVRPPPHSTRRSSTAPDWTTGRGTLSIPTRGSPWRPSRRGQVVLGAPSAATSSRWRSATSQPDMTTGLGCVQAPAATLTPSR